jgi:hypothetical protein
MIKSLAAGLVAALFMGGSAFAACADIASKVVALSACVDSEWQATEGIGAQEFTYMTADESFGLMVITEKEAIPSAAFRDAIIQNAISGSGSSADQVKVVGERIVAIGGQPFNVIEYTIPNSGNPILFQNFYYSAPGFGSVQILAYSLDTDATATAFKAGLFAHSVKLGG